MKTKLKLQAQVAFLSFIIIISASPLNASPIPEAMGLHSVGLSGAYENNGKHACDANIFYNYNYHTPHSMLKSFNINTDIGYRFGDDNYRLSYDLMIGLPFISIGGIHHFTPEDGALSNGLTLSLNIMFLQAGYRVYDDKKYPGEVFFCMRLPILIKDSGESWKTFFSIF